MSMNQCLEETTDNLGSEYMFARNLWQHLIPIQKRRGRDNGSNRCVFPINWRYNSG